MKNIKHLDQFVGDAADANFVVVECNCCFCLVVVEFSWWLILADKVSEMKSTFIIMKNSSFDFI